MSDGRIFIKNWERFQHYKVRRPPWIKLHRTLLDDRDFLTLPLVGMALAPLLWLLASENEDGSVPADIDGLAWRLRRSPKEVFEGIKALATADFVSFCNIDASNVLAECYQGASEVLATRYHDASSVLAHENEIALRVEERQSRVEERQSRERGDASETLASRPPSPEKRFKPPTLQEVRDYCLEKGYTFDPELFVAYYESKGWKVGIAPMKKWQAACATFQKRENWRSDNEKTRISTPKVVGRSREQSARCLCGREKRPDIEFCPECLVRVGYSSASVRDAYPNWDGTTDETGEEDTAT
jgi:hypothetical protein